MRRTNYLVCWEENNEKRWEMIKEVDNNTFLLNLLTNKSVDQDKIFVIPTNGFMLSAIWLKPDKHKSQRVDFWNFYEDYGCTYEKPQPAKGTEDIAHELDEKTNDNTKYGWISPEGKYYHCGYQGHIGLASRICFGMTETNNPERYLETHGWCKIYKSLFSNDYSVYVGDNHVITDEQMKTLISMGLDKAKDLSNMLCKDRP